VSAWLIRALSLVALHVLVRTGLAWALRSGPAAETALRFTAIAVLVAVVLVWAGLDAVRDDPADESRPDLMVRWSATALLVGPLAGLFGWALQSWLVDASGAERLGVELTGGAAFTVLLVLVPGVLGVALGRRIAPAGDRNGSRDG